MTFLRVHDNSGYLKCNFISDDDLAGRYNEVNRLYGYPPVTSPGLMGGYCYPILNDIVREYAQGATYQILKAPLPKEDSVLRNFLNNLGNQPETVYAYVDSGDITIVQIEGWNRSAISLPSMGWNVINGQKTFKRLKTLNRPFRLWDISDKPLRVAVVDDDAYCNDNDDLSEFSESEIERLLDGAFVISRNLFNDCLVNVKFPELQHDHMHPEFAVDHYRNQEYLRQSRNFHAFNARIFGPMHFIGLSKDDELHTRPGMLKGEAFIDVSGMADRMHVDVICTRSALKFEVSNIRKRYVMMEPQTAKKAGVSSDLQTMINMPALYQPQDVKEWTKNFLFANFERLRQNKIMESWYDLSSPYFNTGTRVYDQNDVLTLTKWNARAWLMSGLRITDSPWLFEQLGAAIAKTLRVQDQSKLRFPVPCAVRAQCISASFASMSGSDMEIEQGQARWNEELDAIVVNDIDWIDMYRSHGGHDLDDFFVAYWRTIAGQRKIVMVRSPNDWGEYSVFDYVEGDWYPQEEVYNGNVIMFPEISDDSKFWAERLSQAYNDGKIIYTGLPSKENPPHLEAHPYGWDDVASLIENNRSSASCVGANVNARSLWSLSKRQHRQVQLAPMEDCIDTGTQGGSQEDIQAVHAEAKDIVDTLIRDSSVDIDEYMWMTRFANIFNGIPFSRMRLNGTSHVSQAHKFRTDVSRSFNAMVRKYAQDHLTKNLNPVIHALGKKHLRDAYNVLVATRTATYQMQNPGEQSLEPQNWFDVHSLVLDRLNCFDNDIDKYDFVLGLYSASFKAPTASYGRITDQLVMNPHIFPYLLNALRFYGLARYIGVDENGNLTTETISEWDLICVKCSTTFHVTDPVMHQNFHTHNGVCIQCRTPQ